MLGEDDPFVYHLARDLNLTLGQMEEMPFAEYLRWRAFYKWEKTMQAHWAKVWQKRAHK